MENKKVFKNIVVKLIIDNEPKVPGGVNIEMTDDLRKKIALKEDEFTSLLLDEITNTLQGNKWQVIFDEITTDPEVFEADIYCPYQYHFNITKIIRKNILYSKSECKYKGEVIIQNEVQS